MVYYLFIDESGDHGLTNVDPSFPVFVLCGILISSADYGILNQQIVGLKSNFWEDKKVILHSSDIRKCNNEFQILFNQEIKASFYDQLNTIMADENYKIIAAAIDKKKYINKYGKIADNVYNIALSFILERAVFCMDKVDGDHKSVRVIIEKRGGKEDALLAEHMQKVISRGTYYVSKERIKSLIDRFRFFDKKEDIAGLQIADLAAYPIARYVIDPTRANPAFDIVQDKFYTRQGKRYGLKVYP